MLLYKVRRQATQIPHHSSIGSTCTSGPGPMSSSSLLTRRQIEKAHPEWSASHVDKVLFHRLVDDLPRTSANHIRRDPIGAQ